MRRPRIASPPTVSWRIEKKTATSLFSFMLSAMLLLSALGVAPVTAAPKDKNEAAKKETAKTETPDATMADATAAASTTTTQRQRVAPRKNIFPTRQPVMRFAPVNVQQAADQEALAPSLLGAPAEIKAIDAPRDRPDFRGGVPIVPNTVGVQEESALSVGEADAPPASSTGTSPGANRSFKGEFLTGTTIPPDTHGAVGTNHVVTVTNDSMRIQTREGVQLVRMTLNAFWAGIVLEGGATASTFDPKALYDRFNNRYIIISSANAQSPSSAALFAVSQTGDPTGTWFRYAVDADPTATATSGRWIDYPSIGINKNHITVMENDFYYGAAPAPQGYAGPTIFVLDKQAAFNGDLSSLATFRATFSTDCVAPFETALGCGFTIAPAITEDNTTETTYMVEDWDNTAGQLRLSKITGTPTAPVLTVGTQFPQSANSWRFDARRIGTSGGYAPQRQQAAHLPSGGRIQTNDSRIQNSVLRNGTLWTAHTVMLAATPTAAGTAVGGATNPDIRAAIQWWAIDPTIETGVSQAPLQRARIEDPVADNCHNGSAGLRTDPNCNSTIQQKGQFFAFPSISVNRNNDVLIGYTQFSSLTYPSTAYSLRMSTDAANTMRDTVVYRPGQANYNIGAGSGTTRQNRWGDYSASQTDPVNDTDFWTNQEYAGTVRDFGIGLAGNWETWWTRISPSDALPSRSGSLIISEFRLRGPQGVRDEFVKLYNPSTTPVLVNASDNTEGWALAFSANGTTVTSTFAVIPNGTVIPGRGSFLVANNPDGATAPTLTYSLNSHPSTISRTADSDTGYSVDLADNGGIALFRTSNVANFTATTRMDSVGFASIAAGLFKEGNGIPAVSATTPTGQISFLRDLTNTAPKDTGVNETDFRFVDPVVETLGTTPQLGAAGPQNLNSPVANNTIRSLFVPGVRERIFDSTATGTNATAGTLTFQRRYANNTGAPITRLRFRVIDITTLNSPDVRAQFGSTAAQQAILRVLDGNNATVSVDGAPFQSLRLETPPAQPEGGALNSTLAVGTIATPQIIGAGESVTVQFRVGVQQGGYFRFIVSIEADK